MWGQPVHYPLFIINISTNFHTEQKVVIHYVELEWPKGFCRNKCLWLSKIFGYLHEHVLVQVHIQRSTVLWMYTFL